MATYRVTVEVTCTDQAELDSLKSHLLERNIKVDAPGMFDSRTDNDPAKKITLISSEDVGYAKWR